jgi:Family of unknown function (DUF6444)
MELAQRNDELAGLVSVLGAKVEALEVEVASLRRQVGRDSSNSSQPPSQDGPAAKGKARAVEPGPVAAGTKRRAGAVWFGYQWLSPPVKRGERPARAHQIRMAVGTSAALFAFIIVFSGLQLVRGCSGQGGDDGWVKPGR